MAESVGLSTGKKVLVAAIALVGIGASFIVTNGERHAAETAWQAAAGTEAKRLTQTFGALMEISRGPLQSLATLFNGSGRVAAEEFTETVGALKSRSGEFFPSAMAFMAEAKPAGCDPDKGCWLVAYSTVEDGLLKPGADMSRYAPTAGTIAAAIADPNVMKLGPIVREADGAQHSFLAVTIKNTRQFGVIVSVMDYAKIMAALTERWLPNGVSARIEATFPTTGGMTAPEFIFGEAAAPAGTRTTVTESLTIDRATFKLSWDFSDTYLGGADRGTNARFAAGILASLLAAAVAALLMRGSG